MYAHKHHSTHQLLSMPTIPLAACTLMKDWQRYVGTLASRRAGQQAVYHGWCMLMAGRAPPARYQRQAETLDGRAQMQPSAQAGRV